MEKSVHPRWWESGRRWRYRVNPFYWRWRAKENKRQAECWQRKVRAAHRRGMEEAAGIAEARFSDPAWNSHIRRAGDEVAGAVRAAMEKDSG